MLIKKIFGNTLIITLLKFQILSLITFILSVSYERLTVLTSNVKIRKNKKKSSTNANYNADSSNAITNNDAHNNISLTDKDRLALVVNIIRVLKPLLNEIDTTLDTWKTPVVSKSLTDILASMSLNPKVEDLVNGTFREDHKYAVKELKIIVKDKIKMINKV